MSEQAGRLLIGNDEHSFINSSLIELCERMFYHSNGCNIQVISNYVSCTTQYYIQDINA